MLGVLKEAEFVAAMRLALAYVIADGVLSVDDKTLGVITKTGRNWPDLRDKLLAHGLGHIEDGRWIDEDQEASLEIQRRLSERGIKANVVRWGRRSA